jgi:hypothetical protein
VSKITSVDIHGTYALSCFITHTKLGTNVVEYSVPIYIISMQMRSLTLKRYQTWQYVFNTGGNCAQYLTVVLYLALLDVDRGFIKFRVADPKVWNPKECNG